MLPWIGQVGLRKAFVTVSYNMHWIEKKLVVKIEYNDPHNYASNLLGFPLLCELTLRPFYGTSNLTPQ